MKKTIESIQNQTYKNFEVLIIDGGSTNETQLYSKTLQAPFFYQSKKDKGIYDAMNTGISLATGEWLYFLGSGDFLSTSKILSEITNHLEPNVDLYYGNISYEKKVFHTSFSRMMWIKNTLHHQAVLYHKRIFEQTKYDVFYKILADYDLSLRLLQRKVISKKVNKIIAFCDENGISKNYNLQLYKEELHLKKRKLSLFYYPLLYLLFGLKYFFRKKIIK